MAIAIPVFTTQLEKSREATDVANVRSAYAQVVAEYLTGGDAAGYSMTVTAKQAQPNWQGEPGVLMTQIDGVEDSVDIPAHVSGESYTVKIVGNSTAGGTAVVTID